jgi:hypothetical protein
LLPGAYTVRAFHEGAGEGFVDHVKLGDRITVPIRPTGTIEGTVRTGSAPLSELYVAVTEQAGILRREHFMGTNGHYVFRDLVAGSYTIIAYIGRREIQARAVLGEAETKQVDLDVNGGVTLTGRLVDVGTKLPIAGIPITTRIETISYEMDSESSYVTTDSAGRFRIEHVPLGTAVITAMPPPGSDYGAVSVGYAATADADIGDFGITRARVKGADPHGQLGITWTTFADETPSAQRAFQVAAIDPSGPAATTALQVGDIITTIEGVDARGNNRSAAWVMLDGPPGAVIRLGTARGVTVAVTLAKP